MAKRLSKLESQAIELHKAFDGLYPEFYKYHDDQYSEPTRYWRAVENELPFVDDAICKLAQFYRDKAGIKELGPLDVWDVEKYGPPSPKAGSPLQPPIVAVSSMDSQVDWTI